ncbi:protein FRIGIDA [Malania oleifera]|uniref:protein FRIGIDA n=1 Tax=Malania oleifera TaxID=397392 RepID=UPI0025AE13FA|nr:protein FRIGIDA [Malania oleifera]
MTKPSVPVANLDSTNMLLRIKQEQKQSPLAGAGTGAGAEAPPPPLQNPVAQARGEVKMELQEEEEEPQYMKSINELASLSATIHTFKSRFEDLKKHLDFIQNAIDSEFKDYHHQPEQQEQQVQIENKSAAISHPKSVGTDQTGLTKPPDTETGVKASRSEIQHLCETMCSRGLRKYIATHMSNIGKLREEAPAALRLAPKPAKLVLECIGRFFLQGSKAYNKNSPMISSRQASVLILELFLLMLGGCGEGEVEIESSVKEEAEQGAIAWRKRLISEGGVGKASETDAKGLLLFIACFGIPAAFKSEDVGKLLRLCNIAEISDALKVSRVLVSKMADIMDAMGKNGMHVEAIDIAYTLGIEDKFPPQTILTAYLRESKEAYKKARRDAQSSPVALKEANEMQLDALKSVVKCLEDRKWDLTKLLGGWQIKEKMVKLEKENADLDKRIEDAARTKRKLDEMGSSSKVKVEAKRAHLAAQGSPMLISPNVNSLHERRAAIFADGMRSYDSLVPKSLESGISGLSSYSGMHAAAIGGSVVPGAGALSMSSYAGARGDIGVDKLGHMTSKTGQSYGWHGVDVSTAAYTDRPLAQNTLGQSASKVAGGLFGPLPSVEGFAGLPDFAPSGASNRASASDLYRFADDVVETDPYGSSSHRPGALPPVVPARHPSYMY